MRRIAQFCGLIVWLGLAVWFCTGVLIEHSQLKSLIGTTACALVLYGMIIILIASIQSVDGDGVDDCQAN